MPEPPADLPEEETPDVVAHSAVYDETPCIDQYAGCGGASGYGIE
jgi:hypothetical protein